MGMTEQEKEIFKAAGNAFADATAPLSQNRLVVVMAIEDGQICASMTDGIMHAGNLAGVITGASHVVDELLEDNPEFKAETTAYMLQLLMNRKAKKEQGHGISDLLN